MICNAEIPFEKDDHDSRYASLHMAGWVKFQNPGNLRLLVIFSRQPSSFSMTLRYTVYPKDLTLSIVSIALEAGFSVGPYLVSCGLAPWTRGKRPWRFRSSCRKAAKVAGPGQRARPRMVIVMARWTSPSFLAKFWWFRWRHWILRVTTLWHMCT